MSSWACRYGVLALVCAGTGIGGCSITTSGGAEPSYPAPPPYRSPAEAEAAAPAAPQPVESAAAANDEPAPPWLSELPEPAAVLAVFPSPTGDYPTIARSEAAFAVLVDYVEVRAGVDQSLMGEALLNSLPPAAQARWHQYVPNGYSKLLSSTNGSWQLFISPQFRAQVLLQFVAPASVAAYETARNAIAGVPGPADPAFIARLTAPRTPSAAELVVLGDQYLHDKNYADAVPVYRRALELQPDVATAARAHWCLGEIAYQQGDYEAAVPDLEEAARLDPENPTPFVDLSICYAALDDPPKAVANAQQAVRLRPTAPVAWHALGRALAHAGDFENAMEVYRTLQGLDAPEAAKLLEEIQAHQQR